MLLTNRRVSEAQGQLKAAEYPFDSLERDHLFSRKVTVWWGDKAIECYLVRELALHTPGPTYFWYLCEKQQVPGRPRLKKLFIHDIETRLNAAPFHNS